LGGGVVARGDDTVDPDKVAGLEGDGVRGDGRDAGDATVAWDERVGDRVAVSVVGGGAGVGGKVGVERVDVDGSRGWWRGGQGESLKNQWRGGGGFDEGFVGGHFWS